MLSLDAFSRYQSEWREYSSLNGNYMVIRHARKYFLMSWRPEIVALLSSVGLNEQEFSSLYELREAAASCDIDLSTLARPSRWIADAQVFGGGYAQLQRGVGTRRWVVGWTRVARDSFDGWNLESDYPNRQLALDALNAIAAIKIPASLAERSQPARRMQSPYINTLSNKASSHKNV